MSELNLDPTTNQPGGQRFLPLLLLLFFASGCAALIYEIVWFQLLPLVIGSTAVSLGVLLGTYMGGLCLGSFTLPRLVSVRRHPLRVYAGLELGIGICGLAVLAVIPLIDRFYAAAGGGGQGGILLRSAVGAVCLLPPTFLMGGTLPAVARWLEMTPRGVSWLGLFYGANTAGAVFGCLLAGFYLLRVSDTATATFAAAVLNGSLAAIALILAALAPYRVPAGEKSRRPSIRVPGSWSVTTAIALSGLSALGAEVIWTRQLSLLLGGTVYAFSIILAVFLMGIGIGSAAGSALARRTTSPRLALGLGQFSLAAAIAWTALMMSKSLPYWPVNTSLAKSPWLTFQLDLARCLWAILPATLLWGASFPLALAAAAARGRDPGRLVGRIYAANTVGAILGAVGFSLVIIPSLGTQQSQRLLIGIAAAAALVTLGPLIRSPRTDASIHSAPGEPRVAVANQGPYSYFIKTAISFAAAAGLVFVLILSVAKSPWELVAYGRRVPSRAGEASLLYFGEGMNASVAVTETASGKRVFHVSGRAEASSDPPDMRMQRLLGHLPALLHPKPRTVLVVGCGAGVTAGSFVLHPDVKRIVICEIEPLIPRVVAGFFNRENHCVLDDPRTEVVIDDARHYILRTKESFDIITSDPIHPWIKGSATLYTKEYFELCKRHLNPGGVITQWVPLYESSREAVQSEFATFFEAFPEGTIWSNDILGFGYDVVLLGQAGVPRIDVDALETRLGREDYQAVAQSLREMGFRSAIELLSTFAGSGPDLELWLKNAEINRDRNLRLQYLAGMALDSSEGPGILSDLMALRRFPEQLFIVSDDHKREFRRAMGFDNSR
jgi:spermidine synthase